VLPPCQRPSDYRIVCLPWRIFIWLRPGSRVRSHNYGVFRREIPQDLLGQQLQGMVCVNTTIGYVFLVIHFSSCAILIASVAAWFGSLLNAPIADKWGRKRSILLSCVIFIIGSAIQAGAVNTVMVFTGT
jgi:MFS family permease